MSKKNKFKTKFNSIFNKIMKVSDIEKLDFSLKQIEDTYTNVSSDYFKCRAEIKYTEKEIGQVKAEIAKYENYGRTIAAQVMESEGDKKYLEVLQEKAQNAYNGMNLVNSKLKMLEENLKVQNQVFNRLEKTRESLKSKIEEIRTVKTQLEMKASFTESMKKYSVNVEDYSSDFNVDEIIKNVDVDFDAINFKLEEKENSFGIDKEINNINLGSDAMEWINKLK